MEERIRDQRTCFAVKACHMMGKSVEEASRLLAMDPIEVRFMYNMIEKDMVDFDSGIDD